MKRRTFIQGTAAAAAAASFPGILLKSGQAWAGTRGDIPVGVLYSLTGNLAIVESSMNQTARMVIQQINDSGGVLGGRKLKPVIYDPKSDMQQYSLLARKLILRDKVAVIFGGYTSASRKAVKPIVESLNNLFCYGTWFEGAECSKHILYAGAACPNQALSNSVPWMMKTLGKKKMFIVGSDYAFPRGNAKVIKQLLKKEGGSWVADEYLPLGASEWAQMVHKIRKSGADSVFSNVVGDSIVAFYREFLNQGLKYDEIPIMSSTTTEIEIKAMGPDYAKGSYSSFPYFMSIQNEKNKAFVKDFKDFTHDQSAVTQAASEGVVEGINYWKMAVEKAGSPDAPAVIHTLETVPFSFDGPEGVSKLDPQNLYTYLTPRIGHWQADGQAKIVDAYSKPLEPLPYIVDGETAEHLICTINGVKGL